ncbi:MAG: FkbM family methyltransferase [Solirubrobacteraceae bacterium]|jgi:FkbM family methyltransferase
MIRTIREHTFFRGPLRPSSYVLDLGAHRGEFAREVVRRYGVTCIAVEPAAEQAGEIERDGVRVRQMAIATEPGDLVLYVAENPEGSSVVVGRDAAIRSETVHGIPLATLLEHEHVESVALAKVDIEGAELGMFMQTPDEALRRVAQFSVEFHTFTGALTDADVERIAARLQALGFAAIRFSAGHHNWLFFQPGRCGVGTLELLVTRYLVRNARGATVRAGRQLSRAAARRSRPR